MNSSRSELVLCEDTDHGIICTLTVTSKLSLSSLMKDRNKTATVHSSLTPLSPLSVSPCHTAGGLVGKLIAVLHQLHYRDIVKLNHLSVSVYAFRKQKNDSPRCSMHA